MGLRERKKQQTADRLVRTALERFVERGYDAVTMTEIAEAADVARATLFTYFPTKESLVLAAVGDDDPAAIVAGRPPGTSVLEALAVHFRSFAAAPQLPGSGEGLVELLQVIVDSPALTAGVNRLADAQRDALATVLHDERPDDDPLVAPVAAAQITATILALRLSFFGRLVAGEPLGDAVDDLPAQVDLAFALLDRGLGDRFGGPRRTTGRRRPSAPTQGKARAGHERGHHP